MKVNIYYGGRGILGDPTLFVINKITEVLTELNVKVEKFSLFEQRSMITSLPASINDADGIILASSLEWYGIGGYLMQFLDACWLYGNKEKIATTYMCPIVMATASGEREAMSNLSVAWDVLGGLQANGLCGYVEDPTSFELNTDYIQLIEKCAENLYRTIQQKVKAMPSSNQSVKHTAQTVKNIPLTPQETEQLSKYAADDAYVQQQKEDIKELSTMFKGMLKKQSTDESGLFITQLEQNFKPEGNVNASFRFMIEDIKKSLVVIINDSKLRCYYGNMEDPDVLCKLTGDVMNHIIAGQIGFQRAFMTGEMQIKGDFRNLMLLDQVFTFTNEE